MPTIAVVDDEAPIRELLAAVFAREGYRVLTAVDGAAALDLIAGERPDVVLMDVMMPNLDGLEVAARLRANQATAEIPVVLMSAAPVPDPPSFVAALVPKPFTVADLIETVARVVGRSA